MSVDAGVIDLSSNNPGPYNFPAVAAAGVAGVIVKATEGTHYVNPGFVRQAAAARAAGLVVGYYHFARPGVNSAADEAAAFLAALPSLHESDIVALDIETGAGDASPWALAWCQTVRKALGQLPLIYSYPDYINHWLQAPELAPYPLWLADLEDRVTHIGPWPSVALRQYTWTGRLSGIGGNVDMSRCFGGVAALRKLGKPAPAPIYPRAAHVTVKSALKQQPSHSSAVAITELHKPLPPLLSVAVVLVTGPVVVTDDRWLPCKLSPTRPVHGWLPEGHVKVD